MTFKLKAVGGALCTGCHQGIGRKQLAHEPVKGGECLSCHRAHGGESLLLDAGSGDLTGLCLSCHDAEPFKRSFVHGPVAEGACQACHDPHDAVEKGLLKDGARKLCLSCHQDFAKGMLSAQRIHKPVQDKPCTSCHDPHSASFRYLLKKKMPELCLDCHQELGKKMGKAKVVHKPLTDERGCSNCHSTHFSRSKGLLTAAEEAATCLACHNSAKVGQPPLRNIKKELEGKAQTHGPLRKGRCSGCHDPHASDYRRILTRNYTEDFYVPFRADNYSLCLSCHDGKMLEFAKTTLYTGFRDGSRNLHYLHVNNSKGRSCRACHESHSATGEKLIGSEGAKFGDWRVRSRFKRTATGGSCAPGCHKPYSYDRNAVKREQRLSAPSTSSPAQP